MENGNSGSRYVAILALALTTQFAVGAHAESWLQLTPTGGPPSARERMCAVYDPSSNRMVVFGGRDSGFNALDELWVLEHADDLGGTPNWIQLSPTGTPGGRILHTCVYDSTNNRLTLFGGRDASNSTVGDVWVLSNANGLGGTPAWTQLSPTGTPPSARYRHTAVYDAANNRMTIFAGAAGGYVNDVWVLTNANGLGGTPAWTQLSPTGGPPGARSATSAIYDPSNNRMVIFGGWSGASPTYNDVWVLTNANGLGGSSAWAQLSPTGGPPSARTEHTAVYELSDNRMIVFGGEDSSGALNEVWVLSNANGLGGTPAWTLLTPTGGPPSARVLHTAIYDGNGRMTIFGGAGNDYGGSRKNDVWVLAEGPTGTLAPAMSSGMIGALAGALALIGLFRLRRLRRGL